MPKWEELKQRSYKHTPGPWIQGNGRGDDSHIVRDSNNNLIADVAGPSTRDRLVSKANARLIASVPAMIEAIEKAGRIVGQLLNDPSTGDQAYALSRAYDALGITYFKATGNSLALHLIELDALEEERKRRRVRMKNNCLPN
tara:strand:- start:500 stop:925 length:426 start_codon:yes stop_codon:yes gene_type:complete